MEKPGAERACGRSGGVEDGQWQMQVLAGRRTFSERPRQEQGQPVGVTGLIWNHVGSHVDTMENRWREWSQLPRTQHSD